ncbi:SDR family NAD(P)-dependent oxidoreductase [Mesobacillus zeae]|uniref:SDR family oxidoreductase n=1 Tax=Mesobacillus zeae TaxID=1917180 RepID=A0A398B910_9BACI|nr:SDR family oxidoreductase [Mesobacillus zeae]RID84390.1 SDR family oxidoreductase [Mesobacillus zeae]
MKTIIVTGAGTGLGKELSLLFSQKEYHIVLAGRHSKKLAGVRTEIEQAGGSASELVLDVRNHDDIKEKMLVLNKSFDLYGLINNAGIGVFGPFTESRDKDIEDGFSTNVYGPMFMTKALLPYLELKGEGLILNIISTAGLRGKKNEAVYCAGKFALRGLTESLQKEYEGTGIQFVAAYMGGMNTPFWEGSSHVENPESFRSPHEVAEIILSQLDQKEIIIESKKR